MILLILSILFGLASAAGYVLDKEDEDKQRTWICTFRSLLAAVAFALLMLFLFWCIFFNEGAIQRDHTERKNDGLSHPDKVHIKGETSMRKEKAEEVPDPKMPDAYRHKATFKPLTLVQWPGDSVIWFKLYKPVYNAKRPTTCTYRFAMTNGKDSLVVEADSAQVRFVKPARDKQPYVQIIRQWNIKEYPLLGRQPSLNDINYIIRPPHELRWIEFTCKE